MKGLNPKEKLDLYRSMVKIRSFEEAVYKLTTKRLVQGSVHFSIGQEAIAAGIMHCLDKKDYIMSNHRGHGHLIARGADLKRILAELMGKKDGYCSGKGGTMHLMDPSIGMMGANGIVGGGIPITAGIGLACKNFEKNRMVACFFGDGAVNTGAFHESMNLSSLWGLPILFICENNQYAISTSVKRSTPLDILSKRAASYGMEGLDVDGNDLLAVLKAAKKSIGKIKKEKKPILLVCDTYRHMGHSIHDPRTYRTKAEEERWKKKDPIERFENILRDEGFLDDKTIGKVKKEIDKEIEEAIEFGLSSPKPEKEDLYKDVYYK